MTVLDAVVAVGAVAALAACVKLIEGSIAWSTVLVIPAGANELKSPSLETLKITAPVNVMLVNSRPAFKEKGTILLHFRELEGLPAEVKLSSSVPGKTISRMIEVNASGKQTGQPLTSIQLKPYEVRFIEVSF